jgi:hypothetical protein
MRKSKGQKFLRTADIMAALGIVLLLGAHFVTQVAIWSMRDYSTEITSIALAYEANPLAVSLLTSTSGIAMIISYVIQPALLFAGYYLMRKKYLQVTPNVIMFVAAFLFFAGLTNVLNDLGGLIGLMM